MPSYSSSSSCASKNSLPLSALQICSTLNPSFFASSVRFVRRKKKEKKRSILLADEGDGDIAKRFVERVAFALVKIFWL